MRNVPLSTALWLSLVLCACGSPTGSTEPEPGSPGSTGGERTEAPPDPTTAEPDDEGALCAGPYHRASSGAIACPNRDGGWSSLVGCFACSDTGGECRQPGYAINEHPSGCSVTGDNPCPEPQYRAAGACDPTCCDTSLPPMPAEVEGTLVTPMPGM